MKAIYLSAIFALLLASCGEFPIGSVDECHNIMGEEVYEPLSTIESTMADDVADWEAVAGQHANYEEYLNDSWEVRYYNSNGCTAKIVYYIGV
jgi:hypothetical protein